MRFPYLTSDPSQTDMDRLPRLPLLLVYGDKRISTSGLVDSGATVNVLPHGFGTELGAVWDDNRAIIRLTGTLGHVTAIPLIVTAAVSEFPPVRLAFAWSQSEDTPLILGQMNFFMAFDVCFFRSKSAFEIQPKSI